MLSSSILKALSKAFAVGNANDLNGLYCNALWDELKTMALFGISHNHENYFFFKYACCAHYIMFFKMQCITIIVLHVIFMN